MKLGMYCVRDSVTGFMTPTLDQNDAAALRNFAMACDSSDNSFRSLMSWKSDDFTLFKIADFDSSSGVLTPIVPPVLVASGYSVHQKGVSSDA